MYTDRNFNRNVTRSFSDSQNRKALIPMSDGELMRVVPSAFAQSEHSSRSERYKFIPTSDVITGLRTQGFLPVKAAQSRCRTADKVGYTKHSISFVRDDKSLAVGDSVPQLLLVNSHDGSSNYVLIGGVYVLVCLNGLIVPESTLQSVKVRHSGDIMKNVIEGSFEVIEGTKKLGQVAADWRNIELTNQEANAYAEAALQLRWDGDEHKAPITADRLLTVRRESDRDTNLWVTFNRVQEALTGGGQRGHSVTGRRQTVRAVTGIDGNVALNRSLWALTEKMAELKAA